MSKSSNDTFIKILENFKTESCKRNHTSSNISCNDSKRKHSIDTYETPEKRNKSSLDESIVSSPWEVRRLKAELIETRSRVTLLENQIQQLHGVRKELELLFENEKKALQAQHVRDKHIIDDLETRLNFIRKREVETKEELVQVQTKLELTKLNSDKKIESLQQIIDQVKDDAFESSCVEQENSTVMTQRIAELEDLLIAAQDDAEAQKKLVTELQAQLNEVNATQRDLEIKEQALQKALLKIKELEFEKDSYIEWQHQSKVQQNRLMMFPELEKETEKLRNENRQLRDAIHNKLILEEQVQDLQKRIESFKDLQQELSEYDVKCSHLESILEEWRLIARNICDCVGSDTMLPQLTKKVIEHLQQQEVVLTSEKMTIDSDLKSCQRELTSLKQENERINKQLLETQTIGKSYSTLIHRLQKKLLLVSRERDSYRSQLDSYEKELTVSIPVGGNQSANEPQRNRIEHLEKMVEDYKDYITKLESDLESVNPNLNLAPIRLEQIKHLESELDQLKNENEKLIKQRTSLEQELERRALQQNKCTASQSKILHLEINPFSEKKRKFEMDIAEKDAVIDKLKRKIKKLEEGIEQSKITETTIINSQEVLTLREKCESYELQMQRLKEMFKSTSQEYRDVCYMLLGYKMDRVSTNNYRLSSMYAESENDNLCFQLSDGTMNLLETPFSATIEDMIDLHLRHQHSIPVFLSAVTMDLFNRTSMTINPLV